MVSLELYHATWKEGEALKDDAIWKNDMILSLNPLYTINRTNFHLLPKTNKSYCENHHLFCESPMTALKTSLSPSKLDRFNIRLIDREQALLDNVILQCKVCSAQWTCNSKVGGHLPPGYWKCPNGCNTKGRDQTSSEMIVV